MAGNVTQLQGLLSHWDKLGFKWCWKSLQCYYEAKLALWRACYLWLTAWGLTRGGPCSENGPMAIHWHINTSLRNGEQKYWLAWLSRVGLRLLASFTSIMQSSKPNHLQVVAPVESWGLEGLQLLHPCTALTLAWIHWHLELKDEWLWSLDSAGDFWM